MSLTSERRTQLLASVELFRGLGPEELAAVADRMVEVDFAEDRMIVRQGEVGTGFFLIATGLARVVRDGETIARLGPGDFFGELSVLDGEPRMATVVTDTTTTCLAIASWDFEALLEAQPRLAILILKGVARRLRAVSEEHRH
jgi:CRP-like cAMP-binding protein